MPIYSMTGYASAQTELTSDTANSPALRLGLEIRSVNSRFLDLTFKMPEELRQHEAALRELVTQHLKRGKVEVRANLESTAGPMSAGAADWAVAKRSTSATERPLALGK